MRIALAVVLLAGCAQRSHYTVAAGGAASDQAIVDALQALGYRDAFASHAEVIARAHHQPPWERWIQQQSCLPEPDGSIRFRTEHNSLVVRRRGPGLIVEIEHQTCEDAGGPKRPRCSTETELSAAGRREIADVGRHLQRRLR